MTPFIVREKNNSFVIYCSIYTYKLNYFSGSDTTPTTSTDFSQCILDFWAVTKFLLIEQLFLLINF